MGFDHHFTKERIFNKASIVDIALALKIIGLIMDMKEM